MLPHAASKGSDPSAAAIAPPGMTQTTTDDTLGASGPVSPNRQPVGLTSSALEQLSLEEPEDSTIHPLPTEQASTTTHSATDSTPPESLQLDETLSDALKSARDRPFVLRQEQDMRDFISDAARSELVLPLMNSYQRLLVHRCADYCRLQRDVDGETKTVTLTKPPGLRLPALTLLQVWTQATTALRPQDMSPFANLPEASNQYANRDLSTTSSPVAGSSSASSTGPTKTAFKIMRRDPSLGSSLLANRSDVNGSSSESASKRNRKDMTIEEREAAYREARQRIFGDEQAEAESAAALEKSKAAAAKGVQSASRRGDDTSQQQFDLEQHQARSSSVPPPPLPMAAPTQPGYGYYHPQHGWYPMTTATAAPPHAAGLNAEAPVFDPSRTVPVGQVWYDPQQGTYFSASPYPPTHFCPPEQLSAYGQPGWAQQGGQTPTMYPSHMPSYVSGHDLFSPFPPTPSTGSSVGAPSPAPSIAGSSSSVSVAGGRDDYRRRRDSRGSGSENGSTQEYRRMAGPAASYCQQQQQPYMQGPVPPPGASGQWAAYSLNAYPSLPSPQDSASKVRSMVQPPAFVPSSSSSGPMAAPASSLKQPQGRLNVAERSLFDPSGSSGGSSSKSGATSGRSKTKSGGKSATATPPVISSDYATFATQSQPQAFPVDHLAWQRTGAPVHYGQQQQQPLRFPPAPLPRQNSSGPPLRMGAITSAGAASTPSTSALSSPGPASTASRVIPGNRSSPALATKVGTSTAVPSIPGLPARPDWVLEGAGATSSESLNRHSPAAISSAATPVVPPTTMPTSAGHNGVLGIDTPRSRSRSNSRSSTSTGTGESSSLGPSASASNVGEDDEELVEEEGVETEEEGDDEPLVGSGGQKSLQREVDLQAEPQQG